MSKQEEKGIENAFINYLNLRGHFCWSEENTGTYDPTKKLFRKFNNKYKCLGKADIIGISKTGKFIAIEVKNPNVNMRIKRNLDKWIENRGKGKNYSKQINHFLQQHDFLCKIEEFGGIGVFASDVSELIDVGL